MIDDVKLKQQRAKLLKTIAQNHPDKSGGEFANTEQKKRYEKATAALEKLDAPTTTSDRALIAMETQSRQLVAIMEAQQAALLEAETKRRIRTTMQEVETRIKELVASKYRPIKFAGYGFGGLGVLLLTLKDPLERLTDLSGKNAGPLGALLAISIAISGGLIVWMGQLMEERETRKRQWLLTEDGFIRLIRSSAFMDQLQEGPEGRGYADTIDVAGIAEAVKEFSGLLDKFIVQEVAEITAQKLVTLQLVDKIEGLFLSPTYTFKEDVEDLFQQTEDEQELPFLARLFSRLFVVAGSVGVQVALQTIVSTRSLS